MKKACKTLGIIAIVAIIGLVAISCDNGASDGANQTPVESDYNIDNLVQAAGTVTTVDITIKDNTRSPGTVENIRYDGKAKIPQADGYYDVSFDVAAATGWEAATGLSAGILMVINGIIMETAKSEYVSIGLSGEGVKIEWGDGITDYWDWRYRITHEYTIDAKRTIIITGLVYTLDCSEQELTRLDVSNATELRSLDCSKNSLTSLDLSKNTALEVLWCSGNSLTSLDLSKNTALRNLSCGSNSLTSLNVSNNTALEVLWCSGNSLTSLNVGNNTALEDLWCSGNSLTSLNVRNNTALDDLWCSGNSLTSLDISNNTALRSLYCGENDLTELDVSNNTALEFLYCTENAMNEYALNAMFGTLLNRNGRWRGYIRIAGNPGVTSVPACDQSIATAKNWQFSW